MRRPWQIWIAYAASLSLAIAAVGWLSVKALQADAAKAVAEHQAALDNNTRLALWRMDSLISPLIAQESARPYFAYNAFNTTQETNTKVAKGKGTKEVAVPSPLLCQSTPLVKLHFQFDPKTRLTSPEVPQGKYVARAVPEILPEEQFRCNEKLLTSVKQTIDVSSMLTQLPPAEPATAMPLFATLNMGNLNNTYFNGQGGGGGGQNAMMANGPVQTPSQPNAAAPNAPPNNLTNNAGQGQQLRSNSQPSYSQSGNSQSYSSQMANPPASFGPANSPPNQIAPGPQSAGQSQGDLSNDNAASQQPPAYPSQQSLAQQGEQAQRQQFDSANNRGQIDFQARARSVAQSNSAAQNYGANSDANGSIGASDTEVQMSMMTPLWIDGDLVLARRVSIAGEDYVQGCLLDWPAIKTELLGSVEDLLSGAELKPATNTDASATFDANRLASLPLVLSPGTIAGDNADAPLSPIKQSLFVAWAAMGLAAIAVAIVLQGVITLSERRGAFVSAVTHELRTPLTTFRMYAEMLSTGMVREEADRRSYLETLRIEADRLTHLVGNVLAYAKLERGSPAGRIETVTVERLLQVATERLADRATQAGFTLSVEPNDGVFSRLVQADPAAVEQILFNLVDNACKYAASATDRMLNLTAASAADGKQISLRLRDHGAGVLLAEQRRLFQPFRKSARDAAYSAPGVGLGLALSKRLAQQMHGDLRFEPTADGACFALFLPAV
ncbi:MAG TPA: ATP-binding protein [Pirellulales bacterium]|jgi:signal transduction histidine kinase